jgi:hypothetical protein
VQSAANGGESVSQSSLKDQEYSTFPDQNPRFERRSEKARRRHGGSQRLRPKISKTSPCKVAGGHRIRRLEPKLLTRRANQQHNLIITKSARRPRAHTTDAVRCNVRRRPTCDRMLHRDSFDPRGHIAEGAPLARVGSGHQVRGARGKAGKLSSAMWRGVGYEPNRRINPMHLDMLRAKRCGARTRSGKPCQSPAMANGGCRMHGGPSPGAPLGNRHAQKHGRHTAEAIARRREISALIQIAVALSGKAIV